MNHSNKTCIAAFPVVNTYAISPSDLLGEKEVAAELGIAPGTLRNWRSLRTGIPYVKLGKRAIRYRRADVDAFIANGIANVEVA